MKGTSLDRAALGRANNRHLGARAIADEWTPDLRAGKGKGLKHIACQVLLATTLWLSLEPTQGLSQADATSINLLSKGNGGHVVVASSDAWLKTIDGNESQGAEVKADDSAIYGFRDGRRATFDTFAVLILEKNPQNVKAFELLAGDSPTGEFRSIGKFTATNAKFYPDPYQEYKFPPVTAKYLEVHILSNWGALLGETVIFQFRLFGQLKE